MFTSEGSSGRMVFVVAKGVVSDILTVKQKALELDTELSPVASIHPDFGTVSICQC